LVTLFELPCTGGPYIFVLGLLAERTSQITAISVLLVYNFFFVLPLILINIAVFKGYTSIESAGRWKEKNIRLLHLITGIIMFSLGVAVLLGIL
jgi:cytochrome c biogenesis protein CcdA